MGLLLHRTRRTEDEPSDAELMAAVASSDDEQALQALIDRHWPPLVLFCARALGSSDEAEDVAQEAFVKLWRGRTDVGAEGSVRGFLYKVARNLIVDRTRRADVRQRNALSVPLPGKGRADPLQDAIGGDFEAALADALASLPPRRRDAFVLVRLQGLSLRDAADAMGVTPRTVANHVYMAGTDLAEALRRHL